MSFPQNVSVDAAPAAISPEGAEIANSYLMNSCSLKATADQFSMDPTEVSELLESPGVKKYISSVLQESAYRSMISIADKLDALIERKWEELEEAEMGSNKDIADLLKEAHKMRLSIATMLQNQMPKPGSVNQRNTQVNVYGEGSYGRLMEKLITGAK